MADLNKIIDDFETEESVKVSFSSPGRKFTELYYSGDCKEFKKVENGKLSGTYGYNQTEYLINFEDIEQIAVESQDHLSTTITVLDLIMVVVSNNHTQKTVDILV